MFHIEQELAFEVNTPFWVICVHSISLVPLVPSQTCAVANNPKILACYALYKISLQLVEEGSAQVCRDSSNFFS
uniref:Uncharacterized protein n=1 Tax=Magallana gigas TaxID=29159 RepID=K1QPT5_MAGGI